MRISLEKRSQHLLSQLEGDKNEMMDQLQQRIEELQQHTENLCKQHEQVLLRAENDKQQALLIGMYRGSMGTGGGGVCWNKRNVSLLKITARYSASRSTGVTRKARNYSVRIARGEE